MYTTGNNGEGFPDENAAGGGYLAGKTSYGTVPEGNLNLNPVRTSFARRSSRTMMSTGADTDRVLTFPSDYTMPYSLSR